MNSLILIFILFIGEISILHGQTEFWTKAQSTLLLSQMRSITPPALPPQLIRDPILDNPNFLPLCGNGRIDKKDDYVAYYAMQRPPLTLTKQQILYTESDIENPDMLHNLTILADEVCDDNNRDDMDGCSADCMHLDLWTSACEIAVDKDLNYEDIIWDPIRKQMVISDTNGIYSLEMNPSDNIVEAKIIASKHFSVTNIFRRSDSLLLYSAQQQSLWVLPDNNSRITLVRNLSGTVNGSLSEWNDRGHQNEDGSIVIHDSKSLIFLENPLSRIVYCSAPAGIILRRCLHAYIDNGSNFLQCDNSSTNTIDIHIGTDRCDIVPQIIPYNGPSLYADITSSMLRTIGFIRLVDYNMNVTVIPALQNIKPLIYGEMYTPWGVLFESGIYPARKLGSPNIQGNKNLMQFIGQYSIIKMMITSEEQNCGTLGTCAFDINMGYDILEMNPHDKEINITWNTLLQSIVMVEASKSPQLLSLQAIYNDKSRYNRIIDDFIVYFKRITEKSTVMAFQNHPITQNLWALRQNKLVEISKSGVHVERFDGRCLPSGVSLCPECNWAPIGLPCRPCTEQNYESSSWILKCQRNSICAGNSLTRRLLTTEGVRIRFLLSGNGTVIEATWPDSSNISVIKNTSGFTILYNITVQIYDDPIGEMRRIRERLAALPGIQVVTPPYVRIYISDEKIHPSTTLGTTVNRGNTLSSESSVSESKEVPQFIIIIIISIMLVVIVIILIVFFMHKCKHNSKSQSRRNYSYHHFNNSNL
jgi:cysteine-rich repeat protein